ncbi:MAG: hypothetical protein Q9160_004923 [Pyrenula sp. 1 TL-2023]
MPPKSVVHNAECDLSSVSPDPKDDSDREKVICSCELPPRSDDNPDDIIRPRKVALHHATDHWRPEADRFVRSTAPKLTQLKLRPQRSQERSSSPSKRKRADRASISPNPGERHPKRESPIQSTNKSQSEGPHDSAYVASPTESGYTTLSEATSETCNEMAGLGSSNSENNPAQQADDSHSVTSSDERKPESDQELGTDRDEPSKSSQSRFLKQPSFPPNLRGGRLIPNRLLQSEQAVSATRPKNQKVIFEGFSSRPKRVYGKFGSRRS